jgi:hypothetical protein
MNDGVLTDAPAEHRHLPDGVGEGTIDRGLMSVLHALAELGGGERPHRADRLRRGERRVQGGDRFAGRADPTQLLTIIGTADIHEGPQLLTSDRLLGVQSEQLGSLRPSSWCLGPFSVLEVVVPELRCLGFAVEILRVADRCRSRDLRDRQHPRILLRPSLLSPFLRHTLHALSAGTPSRPKSSPAIRRHPTLVDLGSSALVVMTPRGW